MEFDRLHNEMAAVRQWNADHTHKAMGYDAVAAMVFWTPADAGESSPTKDCGRNSPQMSYETWLHRAGIVPRGCPRNV